MNNTWQEIWKVNAHLFIAQNWQECPHDKRKDWKLPTQFDYFSGGETSLRVGIVASSRMPKEEDFLLAGMLWGSRLSNGAKTVIYFVAPDFSPFFLYTLNKVGGVLNARAVYWREKLSPSLYLIPENTNATMRYSLGEERPNWKRWRQELNPVAQHQLDVVKRFFDTLQTRRVRADIKPLNITFLWGSYEIAELRRKGKKFELTTKTKWERDPELIKQWQRPGWVDASGILNSEFRLTIVSILNFLEQKEKKGELKPKEVLSLCLHQSNGIIRTLWGNEWEWPWLPKERGENWVHDLSQWYYFQGQGQLSVVCPILEKSLIQASHSFLLSSVLEKSFLLCSPHEKIAETCWDGKIHWLTTPHIEEDLRLFQSWLKNPEQFQIWTLPEKWQNQGLEEMSCRSLLGSEITHLYKPLSFEPEAEA